LMQKNKKKYNFGFYIGIIGALAGIFLTIQGNYFLGVAGGLASAGLAVMNYRATRSD